MVSEPYSGPGALGKDLYCEHRFHIGSGDISSSLISELLILGRKLGRGRDWIGYTSSLVQLLDQKKEIKWNQDGGKRDREFSRLSTDQLLAQDFRRCREDIFWMELDAGQT